MAAERKVTTYSAQQVYRISSSNDFNLEILRQNMLNRIIFEARKDILSGQWLMLRVGEEDEPYSDDKDMRVMRLLLYIEGE